MPVRPGRGQPRRNVYYLRCLVVFKLQSLFWPNKLQPLVTQKNVDSSGHQCAHHPISQFFFEEASLDLPKGTIKGPRSADLV